MVNLNELRNEFLKNTNLTFQEREVIKDLALDTEEVLGRANWLIMEEKMANISGRRPDISDEELKFIQSPQPNTELEKAVSVLKKHGILLNNLVTYAKAKELESKMGNVKIGSRSQNLKEKVLKTVSEWTVLPGTVEGHGFSNGSEVVDAEELTSEDYQEIKCSIIENIKQNKDEWEVKKIITCFERKTPVVVFPMEENLMLVHRSVQPRYDKASLIFEYGKMHYRGAFTNEEWNEIEKVLQTSHNQEIPPKGPISPSKW